MLLMVGIYNIIMDEVALPLPTTILKDGIRRGVHIVLYSEQFDVMKLEK